MSWQDEYQQAKKALNGLFDAAETDQERDMIEAKQMELIEANMRFLIEQMKQRAAEMRGLIQSLEMVIQPNDAGKIAGAAKKLKDVLGLWKTAIGDPVT
jgi:hypothetical protein